MESKAVFFVAQMMPPMCFVVCVFFCRIDTRTLPIWRVRKVIPLESLGISLLQPFFLNPSTLLKMNFKITSNRGSTLGDSMFHTFAIINLIYQEIPPTFGPTGCGSLKPWVSSSPSNATYCTYGSVGIRPRGEEHFIAKS